MHRAEYNNFGPSTVQLEGLNPKQLGPQTIQLKYLLIWTFFGVGNLYIDVAVLFRLSAHFCLVSDTSLLYLKQEHKK
jgi:hypothetical protein